MREVSPLLQHHKDRWADNTPCYVVDTKKLKKNLELFKNQLVGEIAYSYKTNPDEHIADVIIDADCSFLVSSVEELRRLVKIRGVLSERIFFQSPSLSEEQLTEIKKIGIRRFSVDSIEQLYLILENFGNNEAIDLLIRINTGVEIEGPHATYETDTFLGFPIQEAVDVLRELNGRENIRLGIHNHLISQNTNLEAWERNLKIISDFVANLHKERIEIGVVDFGGGFPVEYQKPVPKVEKIFSLLCEAQSKITSRYPNMHYMFEPGRKIVAEAVYLVAKVVHTKVFNGKHVAILDCSLYNSSLDTLIVDLRLPIEKISDTGYGKQQYIIRGSTPDSLDVFAEDILLPELRCGDHLVFLNAGAYSFSSDFISLYKPKTVVI